MNGDSWNIRKAEGGFIVDVNKQTSDQPSNAIGSVWDCNPMVFTDSAALLNFLHNEFVGSN